MLPLIHRLAPSVAMPTPEAEPRTKLSNGHVTRLLTHDTRPRRQSQNPPLQKSSAIPALPWPSKTTFEVFTRASPDNALERLTERSVGLVTDRPSDVYELFVALL